MSKRTISVIATVFVSVFVASGLVYATTRNITSKLGGATNDIFVLSGGLQANALKVTGATFLNGAILNNSATKGVDNPLIFADNVRIDGRVFRGATAGPGDSKPFIINDDAQITGSLTVGSLAGTGIVGTTNIADSAITTAKISDGTIATTDLASNAVTQTAEDENAGITTTKTGTNFDTAAELTITTGANPVFCVFSGYGSNSVSGEDIRIALIYDGVIQTQTYRSANSLTTFVGSGLVVLATNDIATFTAGTHTIQVGWNTTGGTASLFYNTLNCIELKK